MEQQFDSIIIGAGAAGLIAAWELSLAGRKVAVVESANRIGGRIHTIHDPAFELPVELGPEFIHGNLHPTTDLLKRAGIDVYDVKGTIWQHHDGRLQEQSDFIEDDNLLGKKFKQLHQDISVADFLDNYLQEEKLEELHYTLKNYVEGYYAADTQKASTYALRDELNGKDEQQFRVEGGYARLATYLHQQCILHDVIFYPGQRAEKVEWQKNHVTVTAGDRVFTAKQVLITVSMGVLQTERITFIPALSKQMAAARQL
jgi:monoamine oxidase